MAERVFSVVLACALLAVAVAAPSASSDASIPRDLGDTGLYDGTGTRVRPDAVSFSPQYPLWSDGMEKRRWIYLPPGTSIDKSNPDQWEFPVGTRAWKEFSREGRVETRLIERLRDGSWRYATYAWNEAGTEAVLAPEDGIPERGIPSRADCLACHEGAPAPILGYSAVQESPASIAGSTPTARAALGYLHGNCGHCHNDSALPALDLVLAQESSRPQESAVRTLISLVGRYSRFRPKGAPESRRVVPGNAEQSILVARMKSHDPLVRMPPLGVQVADARSLQIIERWIQQDLRPNQENEK